MTRFSLLTALLLSLALQNAAHAQFGFIKDIEKGFNDLGGEVQKGVNNLGGEIEKEFNNVKPQVEQGFNDAGKGIEQAALEVAKAARLHDLQQHEQLIRDMSSNWTQLGRDNNADVLALQSAIQRKDTNGAFSAVLRLMKNNLGFRSVIENADQKQMGSVVFYVNGDVSAIVSGQGALGMAFSLDYLVNSIRTGQDTQGRSAASLFATGGLAIGASVGGSVDMGLGFTLSTPDKLAGPSIDVTLEVEIAVGGHTTISYDPSNGMNLSGIAVGVSGGANVRLSGGVSWTHVIADLMPPQTGSYSITVVATGMRLHDNGSTDKLLSTRWVVSDDYTRFILEPAGNGTHRIKTVATGQYWHAYEGGDNLVSTRWQTTDNNSRFILEQQSDNSYRIRVYGTNRYLHVDGTGDNLLSTRYQSNDDFTRFKFSN
ncbi:MAG: RICIN domain-containing protein [Planctomycetaceae bacterium]|nr:RICIN domain-containing protein [Planctomycetaceae bacterium]